MLQRADAWTVATRARAALALIVALLALHLLVAWVDPWMRSVALFGDAVIRLPVRPVAYFTDTPSVEMVRWEDPEHGTLDAVMVLPGRGPSPGLVLMLGAKAAAPDDLRVVRLTDSLARLGWAVLLPRSPDLDAGRVLPSEGPRLAAYVERFRAHSQVNADYVGFVGLSAGGSVAIIAAADERIAGDVAFVVAIGPYYDAASLVAATASRVFRHPDGTLEDWTPRRITREVVDATLLSLTSDPPPAEALPLIEGVGSLEEAEALVAALAPETREALQGISPRYHLDGLEAPLYLLHDRADEFVPWPESEALAAAAEPAVYHRIDLFDHVEPRVGALGILARDGWRFVRVFAHLFRESR